MDRQRLHRLIGVTALLAAATAGYFIVRWTYGPTKVTLGAIEDVILLPWGTSLPARVDTGAATSSLDARDVQLVGNEEVEFSLPDRYGGQRIRRKLVSWQTVRSSNGATAKRPVVVMDIVLGAVKMQTEVTLNDRSKMDLPLLVGRNTLNGRFVVDVNRASARVQRPETPATSRRSTPPPRATTTHRLTTTQREAATR